MGAVAFVLSLWWSQTFFGQSVVVVVGAGGTPEYARDFAEWAERWKEQARASGARVVTIGGVGNDASQEESSDRDRLRTILKLQRHPLTTTAQPRRRDTLWLVLIGHGTFDGKVAKFNLRGPDVSARELNEWLSPAGRRLAVINCASSSGVFVNRLAGPDRVVVTATKSGNEVNFARFGDYLSAAIIDPQADLDKDGQTSLLEAFLAASGRVEEFYKQNGRLATEHALVEDNGDGRGTPAKWFRGVRVVRKAKGNATPDGRLTNQLHLKRNPAEQGLSAEARQRRDRLELEIARLRDAKDGMDEEEYYGKLEGLMVKLARLYEGARRRQTE